ncbi:electron transfer flavoprotein subunit alpha/FixB family protein [Candidatus Poriferisodalis sp.]|uniref:electron transfer flavoprotein subunit alpha/FixB family protein n=1 Tax=Candidatus Poriferisodalis sp. TaxID=3101277 RepID=UPI003B026CFE
MSGVAVLVEQHRGIVPGSALEALRVANTLAADLGTHVEAVLLGDDALFEAHGDELTAVCTAHGASVVHCCRHELLADYGPDAWGMSLAAVAEHARPSAMVAAGTDRGAEAMAQLAARLDVPLVANCVRIEPGTPWTVSRLQWGGSLVEDVTLESPLPLLTVAQHAVAADASDPPDVHAAQATVSVLAPELGPAAERTLVRKRVDRTGGITLSTATVVVSGGRGVGSADGFARLEELAELLGGRVGCSRAVTNNGWRSHADQVGQTGTRIAPEIYIACGISGAIQHWVGAMGSKNVLAINIDPEANMVTKAGYAVIADLHEVVPAVCDEIRRRRDRRDESGESGPTST